MSVKKAEHEAWARARERYKQLSVGLKKCPNPSCRTLNSPNAQICWRCGLKLCNE